MLPTSCTPCWGHPGSWSLKISTPWTASSTLHAPPHRQVHQFTDILLACLVYCLAAHRMLFPVRPTRLPDKYLQHTTSMHMLVVCLHVRLLSPDSRLSYDTRKQLPPAAQAVCPAIWPSSQWLRTSFLRAPATWVQKLSLTSSLACVWYPIAHSPQQPSCPANPSAFLPASRLQDPIMC